MTTPAALREQIALLTTVRDASRNGGGVRSIDFGKASGDDFIAALSAAIESLQLRTAASEGGEAVCFQIRERRHTDTGWMEWDEWQPMSELSRINLHPDLHEIRYAYTHPPEVARDAEYEFEIWQGGAWQAGGSCASAHEAGAEAAHYEMMYGQDGPVEVRYYVKYRIHDVAISGAAGVGRVAQP